MRTDLGYAARRTASAVPGLVWMLTSCWGALVWLMQLLPFRAVIAALFSAAPASKDSPPASRRLGDRSGHDDDDDDDGAPGDEEGRIGYGRAAEYMVMTPLAPLAGAVPPAVLNDTASAAGRPPGPSGAGAIDDLADSAVELAGIPSGTPTLLSRELMAQLRSHLPVRLWISGTWTAIFSTYLNGMSLNTLMDRAHAYNGPTLLIVRDSAGGVKPSRRGASNGHVHTG